MIFRFSFALLVAAAICNAQQENPVITRIKEELGADCVEQHNIDLNSIFMNFGLCIQTAIMPIATAAATGEDVVNPVVNVICQDSGIKACLQAIPTAVEPCLTADQKTELHHIGMGLKAAHDYSCENNGEPLREAINNGKDCFMSHKEEIQQCRTGGMENPMERMSFHDMFSENKCKEEFEVSKCAFHVLDKCDDKTLKNFYEGLINKINEATPCKDYIDGNFV